MVVFFSHSVMFVCNQANIELLEKDWSVQRFYALVVNAQVKKEKKDPHIVKIKKVFSWNKKAKKRDGVSFERQVKIVSND